jgi:hypothetical protein
MTPAGPIIRMTSSWLRRSVSRVSTAAERLAEGEPPLGTVLVVSTRISYAIRLRLRLM